jgi:GDP-L-fucose synthase
MELGDEPIVVTGGAGFLGAHVVRRLRARGCRYVIVPRSRQFDLRRERDVEALFAQVRPTVVIHLAARAGGIGALQAAPAQCFYDNVVMGVLLMEHARRAGVRKFVAVGTLCSYPAETPVPFREERLWDGPPQESNAAYGLAKRTLLAQAQAYRRQYGWDAISLVPSNLYGPGDDFDPERSRVVPALVRKCVEAAEAGTDEIVVWGDGSPTRDFLYVEDCAEAIVLATERYGGAEPVNVGSGREVSIRELVGLVAELTGFRGDVLWDAERPTGQARCRLDTSRALAAFGFRAGTELRTGLQRTIDGYRAGRLAAVTR